MRNFREFTTWMWFVSEIICDFFFLAVWITMAWAVHEWMEKVLLLHGLPYYTSYVIEGLLDASTLIKLLKLRFGKRRLRHK